MKRTNKFPKSSKIVGCVKMMGKLGNLTHTRATRFDIDKGLKFITKVEGRDQIDTKNRVPYQEHYVVPLSSKK